MKLSFSPLAAAGAALLCGAILCLPLSGPVAQQPAESRASRGGSLEEIIATDPDPAAVERAMAAMRSEAVSAAARLLRKRLEVEKAQGASRVLKDLAVIEEKYAIAAHSSMPQIPWFLYRKPERFGILPNKKTLRLVAFGDFGTGADTQKQVAASIRAEHRKRKFDFGITLGDNFYSSGMYSLTDERWKSQWEDVYSPLRIQFYATLGNHDWHSSDSPAAEALYSLKSTTWRMPTLYYSYTAGPAEFFALNTEIVTEQQLMWLKDALEKSTATWKIVYGHHPIYSGSRSDDTVLMTRLLPILRGKANVYIAGHDHVLAHLKPEAGLEFFVAGGGGAEHYTIRENNPRKLFGLSGHGYLTMDITLEDLTFRFVGADGKELYKYTAHDK